MRLLVALFAALGFTGIAPLVAAAYTKGACTVQLGVRARATRLIIHMRGKYRTTAVHTTVAGR